jgi:6-pyruvoyltetrahydropterin/6-carboxytetrahydropterin synthase
MRALRYSEGMYLVTKRIDFCYGHRLLTTTASASIRTGTTPSSRSRCPHGSTDSRNMVADFSDIKRLVKGWIDRNSTTR